MNTTRFIIASIAVFVFVFVFEFVVHGVLLRDAYEATAQLWRPREEYKMPFMLLSQVSFAAIIAFIFTLNYEDKGLAEGFRFGLYIGLLLASLEIATYSYLPVPLSLALAWVGAALVKALGSGLVLAATYRK